MLQIKSDADIIAKEIIEYIEAKGYQFSKSKGPDGYGVRLEISNLVDAYT